MPTNPERERQTTAESYEAHYAENLRRMQDAESLLPEQRASWQACQNRMNMSSTLDPAADLPECREAVVVVNTASRQGTHCFKAACAGLEARGIRVVQAHAVRKPARIPSLISSLVTAGHRLIVVGGGDGTISSAVGAFAYKESVLGLLPLGTGNSFAQTLEIPQTLEAALDVIASGRVVGVDLGVVNGAYFSNAATIGLSATVATNTPTFLKRTIGPLAYLFTGCIETFRHAPFRAEIDDGETTTSLMTHQIIVANGSIFGASPLIAEAHVDNRRLALITLYGENRWQVAKMWFSLLTGRLQQFSDTESRLIKKCTITTAPIQAIDVDGEAPNRTPAQFSVAAEALRVMVPVSFHEVTDKPR